MTTAFGPLPGGCCRAAHTVGDLLAAIFVEQGGVSEGVVFFTLLERRFLSDGTPILVVGICSARDIALNLKEIISLEILLIGFIHLPGQLHLAFCRHLCRQVARMMQHLGGHLF